MELSDHHGERMHYDAKLGHLEAEVHAIHKRLDGIAADIRSQKAQPKTHIYAVMIGVVGALITIGTFALAPVTENMREMKGRLQSVERLTAQHDADGHPEAVLRIIDGIDAVHTRERQQNRVRLDRDESRLDGLSVRVSVLENVADERTKRFKRALELRDEKLEMRAGDRWTGTQQKVYSEGLNSRLRERHRAVDMRLRELEKRLHPSNG